jgi:hypothetical protein
MKEASLGEGLGETGACFSLSAASKSWGEEVFEICSKDSFFELAFSLFIFFDFLASSFFASLFSFFPFNLAGGLLFCAALGLACSSCGTALLASRSARSEVRRSEVEDEGSLREEEERTSSFLVEEIFSEGLE